MTGQPILHDTSTNWRVLIIEDDPVVARVHHHLVSHTPGFTAFAIARSGTEGRQIVANVKPDLILLDLGLPGVNGLNLLRELRATLATIEVIVVTASSSTDLIRASLHLGAVDYLIKPFEPERLRQALSQFQSRMRLLGGRGLEQDKVDDLRSTAAPARRWLPRGLDIERLALVRNLLAEANGPLAAEDVGDLAAISRVTARRYLEYLVSVEEAISYPIVSGPGRPRKLYERGRFSSVGGSAGQG